MALDAASWVAIIAAVASVIGALAPHLIARLRAPSQNAVDLAQAGKLRAEAAALTNDEWHDIATDARQQVDLLSRRLDEALMVGERARREAIEREASYITRINTLERQVALLAEREAQLEKVTTEKNKLELRIRDLEAQNAAKDEIIARLESKIAELERKVRQLEKRGTEPLSQKGID